MTFIKLGDAERLIERVYRCTTQAVATEPAGFAVAGQRVVVAIDRLPAELSPRMAASSDDTFMRFVPDSFPGFRWRFWHMRPSVNAPHDAALDGFAIKPKGRMNMETKKVQLALATLLAFGAYSQSAEAVQYDPPVSVATLACPAGSSGYDNARFAVFPYLNAPSIWRMTIWCNAAGSGRRGHFEPTAGLFTSWTYAGGLFGAGWPPPPSYGNQYYLHDIDSDGDLDVFRLVETSTNTWTVFLSKAL